MFFLSCQIFLDYLALL